MPDWKQLLGDCLKAGIDSEVISELAGHLEELYLEARSRHLSDRDAINFVMRELQELREARGMKEVQRKDSRVRSIRPANLQGDRMNYRTKSLWLPGLVTLFGASILLMLIERSGFQPLLVWIGPTAMLFYWPWLAGLPIFGALGAFLSQQDHGQVPVRLLAALSPALVMLAAMCSVLTFGLAADGLSFLRLIHFGAGLTNWVVLPGAALLTGALPFLRQSKMASA